MADERWQMLTRIRELRTRLALNEVMRARRAQERARAALDQARSRQTQLEEQAERACSPQEGLYEARRAQELLGFAAALRSKAREAAVPVRRAQLQCTRAQESVCEASARYWREAGRKDVIRSEWQHRLRAARRQQLEREEAARLEERTGIHIARRLREADDLGGSE